MKPPHAVKDSLWHLIIAPSAWAGHFLLCYVTAAVWCAKFAPPNGSLGPVRALVVGYTLLALVIIGWTGERGWRRYRSGGDTLPFDSDTPEDRSRFLGFANFLLSLLSAVAVLFAAVVAAFFEDCR